MQSNSVDESVVVGKLLRRRDPGSKCNKVGKGMISTILVVSKK